MESPPQEMGAGDGHPTGAAGRQRSLRLSRRLEHQEMAAPPLLRQAHHGARVGGPETRRPGGRLTQLQEGCLLGELQPVSDGDSACPGLRIGREELAGRRQRALGLVEQAEVLLPARLADHLRRAGSPCSPCSSLEMHAQQQPGQRADVAPVAQPAGERRVSGHEAQEEAAVMPIGDASHERLDARPVSVRVVPHQPARPSVPHRHGGGGWRAEPDGRAQLGQLRREAHAVPGGPWAAERDCAVPRRISQMAIDTSQRIGRYTELVAMAKAITGSRKRA